MEITSLGHYTDENGNVIFAFMRKVTNQNGDVFFEMVKHPAKDIPLLSDVNKRNAELLKAAQEAKEREEASKTEAA